MDPQTLVLDGGTGHLLKSKGVEALCEGAGLGYDELFAAGSLANALAPQLVREVHDEYIAASAAVITANTFGCTRWSLGKIRRADQAVELAVAGAKIAREAADAAGRGVTVAGACL
jgi:5-methyltetrahydrofolate--homocysteine methyltransferase